MPTLDAIITIDCIPACTKDLTRFEQRGIYAAKVLNASTMGSHDPALKPGRFWSAELVSSLLVGSNPMVGFEAGNAAKRLLPDCRPSGNNPAIHFKSFELNSWITAHAEVLYPRQICPDSRLMGVIQLE